MCTCCFEIQSSILLIEIFILIKLDHILQPLLLGGPDGDVAGNEIKILIREYGANVKIVGISDASGCAEDPGGLDHEEVSWIYHLCKSTFDQKIDT